MEIQDRAVLAQIQAERLRRLDEGATLSGARSSVIPMDDVFSWNAANTLIALAALVAAGLGHRRLSKIDKAVRWELQNDNGFVSLRCLGADAREVRIEFADGVGPLAPPHKLEHDVIHHGAVVPVGGFVPQSSYMAHDRVIVTWKRGLRSRGTWSSTL